MRRMKRLKIKDNGSNTVTKMETQGQESVCQSSTKMIEPETKADDGSLFNGHTKVQLIDCVSHTDKVYDTVKILLLKLFSEDYIQSHSVSGKAGNTTKAAKPAFDGRLYSAMIAIVKDKYKDIKTKDITEKVHSVQKVLFRQGKK